METLNKYRNRAGAPEEASFLKQGRANQDRQRPGISGSRLRLLPVSLKRTAVSPSVRGEAGGEMGQGSCSQVLLPKLGPWEPFHGYFTCTGRA